MAQISSEQISSLSSECDNLISAISSVKILVVELAQIYQVVPTATDAQVLSKENEIIAAAAAYPTLDIILNP